MRLQTAFKFRLRFELSPESGEVCLWSLSAWGQQHDNARSNTIGENASSTARRHDVPRGTMDEVRSQCPLDLPSLDGKADQKIVPPRSRTP
jgi:hypothetical protein